MGNGANQNPVMFLSVNHTVREARNAPLPRAAMMRSSKLRILGDECLGFLDGGRKAPTQTLFTSLVPHYRALHFNGGLEQMRDGLQQLPFECERASAARSRPLTVLLHIRPDGERFPFST